MIHQELVEIRESEKDEDYMTFYKIAFESERHGYMKGIEKGVEKGKFEGVEERILGALEK